MGRIRARTGVRAALDAKNLLEQQIVRGSSPGPGPVPWETGPPLAGRLPTRLRSGSVGERYGMVLVPITSQYPEASSSTDDLVARRQRDGWQLVSARVDSEGAEILVFRRPA